MGDGSGLGVGGGPAGFVWHGAPASAVPVAWAAQVRRARRRFEDEIDDAIARSLQVAVVLVDLGVIRVAPRLPEAMPLLEARVRSRLRPGDHLGLVGEDQLAVLLTDVPDGEVAALAERLTAIFDERLVYDDGETQRLHGTVVWVSGHGDLLWRAFYENAAAVAREHHMVFTEGVFGMPGMNSVRAFGDLRGIEEHFARPMGMEAVHLDVPGLDHVIVDRTPPPQRPATGRVPIRLDGALAGWLRWWSAPGEVAPDHPQFYTSLSAALSETLQRLIHTDAISKVASRDPLTGLLNRRGLREQTAGLTGAYAVALIDIDDFKAVNTELGLAGGDNVLVAVAGVLAEGRSTDIVARWGGEEFLIVLPAADRDDATARLQRLLETTHEQVSVNGRPVTFSCGIATGSHQASFEETVDEADTRLRAAKTAGKARVVSA